VQPLREGDPVDTVDPTAREIRDGGHLLVWHASSRVRGSQRAACLRLEGDNHSNAAPGSHPAQGLLQVLRKIH